MKRLVAWILKCKNISSSKVIQNSVKALKTIGLDVSLLEETQHELSGARLELKTQAKASG